MDLKSIEGKLPVIKTTEIKTIESKSPEAKRLKFKTITLGCKVNQYESQYVRAALLANGYSESQPGQEESTSLVFINTCSVTAESDAKSRKQISRAVHDYPNADLVIMGCFASLDPKKAVTFPRVRAVLTDKRKLPNLLTELGLTHLPSGIHDFDERHRAYIKIQDGCRVGCAYCIIPTVRPVLQSRSMQEIYDEIQCLSEHHYREFVLTGIHLGHYGLDFSTRTPLKEMTLEDYILHRDSDPDTNKPNLARLLEFLMTKEYPGRIRLGSLEAVEVSSSLLSIIAAHPERICPHFHLSMQSGDDTVLKNMRRRWMSDKYIEKCNEIKSRIPNAVLTTDIIVGFPGETNEQFERTCAVVKQIGFSKVHLFRYSPRPGTPAAVMPDQVPEPLKKVRLARLQQIAERQRIQIAQSLVGHRVRVLLEDYQEDDDQGVFTGTSESYYTVQIKCSLQGLGIPLGAVPEPGLGELVDVLVTGNREDVLEAHSDQLRAS